MSHAWICPGKGANLSECQFAHLQNGDSTPIFVNLLLWCVTLIVCVFKDYPCATGCFPQENSKASFLKMTATELIVYGEVEPVPTLSLHPHVLVSLTWEYSLQATER